MIRTEIKITFRTGGVILLLAKLTSNPKIVTIKIDSLVAMASIGAQTTKWAVVALVINHKQGIKMIETLEEVKITLLALQFGIKVQSENKTICETHPVKISDKLVFHVRRI